MSRCRIAIIGGGLAGLAAANALRTHGIQAQVFEAASELGEIGASVNCSPQAVKALHAVGVGPQVDAIGHKSPGPVTRNMITGEFLEYTNRFELAERYGMPYYCFHRADLIDALAEPLDRSHIHLGHRLQKADVRDDGVTLHFTNGKSVDAEYVIAADGVKSVMRQTLYGDDNPTFTGQMVWRALLKAEDVPAECLEPHGHVQWVGPGRHLIAYYIRQNRLVNVVSQVDTDVWEEEGWAIKGDPDLMRASYPNAEPNLVRLLSTIKECSKWGLFTRPITNNWGHGRVQLIGDAAHAMVPSVGQGACMAFEDSYVLGRWMQKCSDPMEAFENFRKVRIPRVHGVQNLSNSANKFKHMADQEKQKKEIKSGNGTHGKIAWVWGFEPEQDWEKVPDNVPEAYRTPA